ncbi:hypothetical protein [Aureicoccus marinus]|uniref:Uncharacterized protein n=1 Tax=Aureicoccus marinus TaxID=754435 RepID=A0A2S7T8H6_9FLAO|nr:hypothetical protein [Aureicoccus marinus]PQJ15954.1 hypothetical protein BST99_09650 [Aureicoccus marinus]
MNRVNPPQSIKTGIIKMRKVLVVFSILQILYFFFSFSSLNTDFINILWSIMLLSFYAYYLFFIWNMPLDKADKWTETILACIFGILAMWMFIQFNDISKRKNQKT